MPQRGCLGNKPNKPSAIGHNEEHRKLREHSRAVKSSVRGQGRPPERDVILAETSRVCRSGPGEGDRVGMGQNVPERCSFVWNASAKMPHLRTYESRCTQEDVAVARAGTGL